MWATFDSCCSTPAFCSFRPPEPALLLPEPPDERSPVALLD